MSICGEKCFLLNIVSCFMQLDTLEYIHSHGYIHADIKGSNLLLGYRKGTENCVYLLDFGLACRYLDQNGVHKEYRCDQRKAHDGTLEYTSRDAHIGGECSIILLTLNCILVYVTVWYTSCRSWIELLHSRM